jgi:hypothetical protein
LWYRLMGAASLDSGIDAVSALRTLTIVPPDCSIRAFRLNGDEAINE